MGENTKAPAVRLVNITKRFPGLIANNRINFEVQTGEIHALLGENGAGKSTLMNILVGLYRPDEGEIYLRGKRVNLRGPAEAITHGIGLVYQHFKLIPNQTVAENVALGIRKLPFIPSLKKIERELEALSVKYGLPVNPSAKVSSLSVGEQQRAEILKVLYLGATIIALDEPTTNLTPSETEDLFKALRGLVSEGYSIIFISHKLEEVIKLASRATILQAGKAVATLDIKEEEGEKEQIARLMIGREADATSREELGLVEGAPPAAEHTNDSHTPPLTSLLVRDLKAKGNSLSSSLKGITFEVRSGEIVGLVGVAGNGQKELAEALAGLRPLEGGSIRLGENQITGLGVRAIQRLGLAYVPEDRLGVGLAPGLNLEDNFILRDYWRREYGFGFFVKRRAANRQMSGAISQYSISAGDPFAPSRLLSGGNLQKLLLARELAANPRILVVANPTRGLDVGASAYVHNRLRQARNAGAGVLLILEDLDEALLLSDRLLVMYDGCLVGEVAPVRTPDNLSRIGLLMAGAKGEVA
ncbi:MAG: ABC transporter ATP-binding protein [Chloroflexi bacterium]|uniref:ABC transporter ATP-binding protein n=1 Tax=Candidatus Chlorohelix allophototropha TaxID=3003348 RepID=A0A8T7M7W7_9CHLR|nr:ABC transporter ATP-binding protein [Chloroflexota bacterium]WJW68174.1 ABC transporter ATP-binding protein [Chloroflexota bacterium L227-S17]